MFFTDNIITLGQTYRWIPSYRKKKPEWKVLRNKTWMTWWLFEKNKNKHVLWPSKHDYNPNWTEFGRFWTNMLNNTCHLTVTLGANISFSSVSSPILRAWVTWSSVRRRYAIPLAPAQKVSKHWLLLYNMSKNIKTRRGDEALSRPTVTHVKGLGFLGRDYAEVVLPSGLVIFLSV